MVAAWVAFLTYAILTPLALASHGLDLSLNTKDSRNFVVLSLVLPIAFCGRLAWKIGRRVGAGAAAAGQWIGLTCGYTFLVPLILSLVGTGLGFIIGFFVTGAESTPQRTDDEK